MFGDIDLRKYWKVCNSDFRIAYITILLSVEWQYYNVFGDDDLQKCYNVCDFEVRIAYFPILLEVDIAKHIVILRF